MSHTPRQDERLPLRNGTESYPTTPTAPSIAQFTSSQSLAQHYIPDKIVSSPSHWGSEARRASRIATGGWGAAAGARNRSSTSNSTGFAAGLETVGGGSNGRSSPESRPSSYRGNGVLFRPMYNSSKDSAPSAFASSLYSPYNGRPHDSFGSSPSVIGPPSSGYRNRKKPAGRDAWGINRGGSAALGAGEYEDDDGLELPDRPGNRRGGSSGLVTPSSIENNEAQSIPARSDAGLVVPSLGGQPLTAHKRRHRWNRFKWALFVANLTLTVYSLLGFIAVIVSLTGMYKETAILDSVNETEMTLAMIAMTVCICTVLVGWAGILLNNRAFLTIYTFMLWIAFIFIVAPGYIAYKKRTFNLSGKMNQIWSRGLTIDERRTVQRVLGCCGYYSPFIEAAADSTRCFSRSILPGCKGSIIDFERKALEYIYTCSFAIVPVHLLIIVTSLLCSDHITYRFGKGVTPKEYRVDDIVLQNAVSLHSNMGKKDKTLSVPRPHFWSNETDYSKLSTSTGKNAY